MNEQMKELCEENGVDLCVLEDNLDRLEDAGHITAGQKRVILTSIIIASE
ncbi:MAG TPA: hypothetical protein VIY48_14580 [Candidatus Paceibacterota bacterium]